MKFQKVDELISREANGTASPRDVAELAAWRHLSLANERHYRYLTAFLHQIEDAEVEDELDAPPLLEDLLAPGRFRRRRAARPRRRLLSVWAAGGLLSAAALAVLFLGSGGKGSENEFGTGEVVTGRSESTTIRLGDGTTVRLGPESRLRVMSGPDAREVWMEGRAYFAVARDESRPFRIRTHAGDAVVLGTRFDIQAREDDLRVLVVEGAVKVGNEAAQLELTASEVGTVGDGAPPLRRRIETAEMDRELQWLGDFVAFENTPLGEAAQELSRRLDVTFVVLDSTLARETVRATFTDESVEEIAEVLCRAVSAHCSFVDERVTIGR